MPDWKRIIRDRMASLRLEGAAEADLTEELSQFLEERYQELLSSGASEEEAYRQTLLEVDDMSPLRAELPSSRRMPKQDTVVAGDARTGILLDDLWRDLR